MPADLLNPNPSHSVPGGVIHEQLQQFPHLFQQRVNHNLATLSECRFLLNWWLPPAVAPKLEDQSAENISIVLAPGHGQMFIFCGNTLQLSSAIQDNPHFDELVREAHCHLPDAPLLGMWLDTTHLEEPTLEALHAYVSLPDEPGQEDPAYPGPFKKICGGETP